MTNLAWLSVPVLHVVPVTKVATHSYHLNSLHCQHYRHSRFRLHSTFNITMSSTTPAPEAQQRPILTGNLDHIALSVTKPALEIATWYRDVIGFTPINFTEFQDGQSRFPSVRLNESTIIDFMPASSSSQPTGLSLTSHICINVTQAAFNDLLSRLRQNGVTYTDPPRKLSGAKGYGWAVYTRDPDGNALEFRYY